MPRETIYLRDKEGQDLVKAQWKYARGYVPGEPNEGLVEQSEGSPARLPDYDDSGWEVCHDLAERNSYGFSFMWYRTKITIPEQVNGHPVQSSMRIQFETCIDDYGEIWIDGECNRDRGVIQGFNVPQRVLLADSAVPGTQYTIAMLAANGPLAAPGGTVFCRYANLGFEWTGV